MFDTKESPYNGWTNYPTWAMNLWLTNDPSSEEMLTELVRLEVPLWKRADRLRDMVEECLPSIGTVFSDLLTWAIGHVDWESIITAHEEDHAERDENA